MRLDDYAAVAGAAVIDDLRLLGKKAQGKVVKHVNSVGSGPGAPETLNHLLPLFQEMGLDARWDVMKGDDAFCDVSKRIHHGLNGAPVRFELRDKKKFIEAQHDNITQLNLDADVVIAHDPSAVGLIEKRKRGDSWIWRCHLDLSTPQPAVWNFLKPWVEKYNATAFSSPQFAPALAMPQILVTPAVDPLCVKNRELSSEEINATLNRYLIANDKPLITQVCRFDRFQDPFGAMEAYRLVKREFDCQLLLVGEMSPSDAEAVEIVANLHNHGQDDPDIHVVALPPASGLEINALQRASTLILHKAFKENFGLVVSEALWKSRPVIASPVGGIPTQIQNQYSGILADSAESMAYWLKQLLKNPAWAQRLGENGHEHVRENFLLTGLLRDYLLLCLALDHPGADAVLLS